MRTGLSHGAWVGRRHRGRGLGAGFVLGLLALDQVISPLILYVACGLGGIGVALSMPRGRVSLAIVGGLICAVAAGLVLLSLGLRAAPAGQLPNIYFYVFGLLAVGSGLRMVTHPRPVYSALYFILTIIASSGLYLILAAEFMAFALIIIYAGAILITYLFVIMLATQAPKDDDREGLAEYDRVAREPLLASVACFVLLAALTTMMFRGISDLPPPVDARAEDTRVLAELPRLVDRELREGGVLERGEQVRRGVSGRVEISGAWPDRSLVIEEAATGEFRRVLEEREWPEGLYAGNVERLGVNLLADHPMTIEIAGVILLMAMLGATVLSRKQVEIEESAKAREARRLHLEREGAS